MANLMASTEQATAEAKGFVSESLVNPLMADTYQHDDYVFCLREVGKTGKESTDVTYLTNSEAFSIMTPISRGGSGLALMPLFSSVTAISDPKKVTTDATTDATTVVTQLNDIGLPLGITVWLDINAVNTNIEKQEDQSTYTTTWCTNITKAGYSVGYYYGNTPPCSCQPEAPISGGNVLQSVSCVSGGSSPLHSISIGENSGVCKIRWAYYSS
ncbi:glycoside hydrolase domain-containing protein [uncultured Shewanella sp.]|uniref:glycoside hydrolase domain-containing protein n=1 Tax=uncultured Shewanella sp. TaxID=173975 RepID=UPI002615B5B3|nr:glycoside hydrolase domain-containing protein [uncultured Shewanella sp.]